jgi:2-polyprenyl-3-methyl-5-hydroxy-6-metoxy-1,4-benzoquinol methylase
MIFKQRSYKKEMIDLGETHYTPEEYEDFLEKLGDVGRWLGGDHAIKKGFEHVQPKSIVDVGCGGGFTAKLLSDQFHYARVLGIDMSEKAIDFCQQRHSDNNPNLHFEHHEYKGLNFADNSFDVVTATLVCHHMNDDELVDFLQQAKRVARQEVIINDMHRHPVPYIFYFCTAPFLFRNRLITKDGLLSIKRAFKKTDWERYLQKAGIQPDAYQIRWFFPSYRYIVRFKSSPLT